MREEQIHIPVKGSMAFTRLWHSKGSPRGTVVLVHGASEHSLRYQKFALFLAHNGYNVVAYDQRGHGYSAVSSSGQDDRLSVRKQLYNNPEFGYISKDEGWFQYLDDLSQVLDYVISRYETDKFVLFGHSMGSMIVRSALAVLPPAILSKINGVILSSHPANGGFAARIGLNIINRHIKRFGDDFVSDAIDDLVLGRFHKHHRYKSMRTELDWISSMPEEVDEYISDPLCGNVMRLGFYKALVEGNRFVFSRAYRKMLGEHPLPLLFYSGSDDPVTGFGKSPDQLRDFYRRLGWDNVSARIYDGGRHELIHDQMSAQVFDDCLGWIEAL